jgi:hypothetical protein
MMSSPLSAIKDITFTGGNLSEPITIQTTSTDDPILKKLAMSFGTATHVVRGATDFQLDNTYGILLFESLFAIQGDIAGYNLNQDEIAVFGFGSPYMTVDFTMINGEDLVLQHVNLQLAEANDGRFYATLNDIDAVFLIERLPFMDIRYELLPSRWFLTPMIMNLSAVAIETPDDEYFIEIDATDIKNQQFTFDGQYLDFDLFHAFFRLITSASHDGVYLGPLPYPGDDFLLKITYFYNEADKAPDILTLYSGTGRRVNVFVNGSGEFAMRELFVSRVLDGIENLINGYPIEENW